MDRVAILGNFDGVHMGHQRLIKKAIDFAKKMVMKLLYTHFLPYLIIKNI
ncbi:adenylyltransferase/cytidyltransferase family protein [Sneathia vaginalis]|nr:adenylyltransferase/cytidyltransferase family protein [Sneathia vaginalis]MDK9582257.1 adenylyltransferase/cytidyltransferase family protein [Sneathia vaginalis]